MPGGSWETIVYWQNVVLHNDWNDRKYSDKSEPKHKL